MTRTTPARVGVLGAVTALVLIAAACTPPPAPAPVNWSFRGTHVTVNDSNDEIRDPIFGACVSPIGCSDEPYLIQIGWQVTIGRPGSGRAWVVSASRDHNAGDINPPLVATLTGEQQAPVTFDGIQPLDVLEALNPANQLTVFGTYAWAMEEDFTYNFLGDPAQDVAAVMADGLNETLAQGTLPSDVGSLLDLVLGNLDHLLSLTLRNLVPFNCLGLCDDVLGGAFFAGIGATGALGRAIDQGIAAALPGGFPPIDVPNSGDNSFPPDIQGGGFFTLTAPRSFTQALHGADGTHTYDFVAGPA